MHITIFSYLKTYFSIISGLMSTGLAVLRVFTLKVYAITLGVPCV